MSEFSDAATTKQPVEDPTKDPKQNTDDENYLEQFVGEGKKYQSVEEAAKALAKKAVHADQFVDTLKKEKEKLSEQLKEVQTRAMTADEIVAALKDQSSSQDPPKPEPKTETKDNQQMTPEQMQKMWEQWDTQREEARKKQEMVESTWGKLASEDVFGDMEKAKVAVSEYIGSNPHRKALIDQMAVADPDGLVTLLKRNGKDNVNFMDGADNKDNKEDLTAHSTNLTWDIVKKIKKENPELYNSTAFKSRMHKELPKE